jgi:LysR family hydrogen peroxide-inducible transcriptional activator
MPLNTFAGLSLRDLEYAVAVADLGHFGKAAAQCGVSQAGLSEQVRKLESLLGCALFERTTRRIAVTPEGEALLRQARQVLSAGRVLADMARARKDPLAGPLRFGVIATLGPYYLPGVLRPVRARWPAMALQLQEGLTDDLLRALLAAELDLLLMALPAPGEATDAEPLFFEPFQAVLPANHALAGQDRVALSDLATDGLLLLKEGHCLRDQALSLCAGARPSARFASSLEMLRHMIAAGEGHSLVPLLAIGDDSRMDGLLCARPLDDPDVGRVIGLVWRASDPRGPAFRAFAAFLRGIAPAGTVADGSRQRADRADSRAVPGG